MLRTGCQWKALPAERFCSANAVHQKFMDRSKVSFFEEVWKAGPAECDELKGILLRWQSIAGAMVKEPLAQETVVPNTTNRRKKREQATPAGGRACRPVVAG